MTEGTVPVLPDRPRVSVEYDEISVQGATHF